MLKNNDENDEQMYYTLLNELMQYRNKEKVTESDYLLFKNEDDNIEIQVIQKPIVNNKKIKCDICNKEYNKKNTTNHIQSFYHRSHIPNDYIVKVDEDNVIHLTIYNNR